MPDYKSKWFKICKILITNLSPAAKKASTFSYCSSDWLSDSAKSGKVTWRMNTDAAAAEISPCWPFLSKSGLANTRWDPLLLILFPYAEHYWRKHMVCCLPRSLRACLDKVPTIIFMRERNVTFSSSKQPGGRPVTERTLLRCPGAGLRRLKPPPSRVVHAL